MSRPRPFRIDVPDSVLDDLNRRLDATRWPDAIPDTGWDYGADLAYIRELCTYWRSGYDWRRWEADINRYPQYLCEVDGVDVQFWHIKGTGDHRFPLLLVHGWPGSMFEFHKLIAPLTNPAAHGGRSGDAFDLVIPSLPGFGFGGKPVERGWGPFRMAAAFDELMVQKLGYGRYGVHGGDWGALITARMAQGHPEHVAAIHVTAAHGTPPEQLNDEDRAAIAKRDRFRAQETGYSNVQGTKPMSLGIAQADSPAGIAAWITEKFRTWSDCGGDIEKSYTKDELLTNIMFYWAPNSIASAARIYFEVRNDRGHGFPRVEVPTGVASFPHEIGPLVRRWVEPHFNLESWTEMPRGGHFAALEEPELLIQDLRRFFRAYR